MGEWTGQALLEEIEEAARRARRARTATDVDVARRVERCCDDLWRMGQAAGTTPFRQAVCAALRAWPRSAGVAALDAAVLEGLVHLASLGQVAEAIGEFGRLLHPQLLAAREDRPRYDQSIHDRVVDAIVDALANLWSHNDAKTTINGFWENDCCTTEQKVRIAVKMVAKERWPLAYVVDRLFVDGKWQEFGGPIETATRLAKATDPDLYARTLHTLRLSPERLRPADKFFQAMFCDTSSPLRIARHMPGRRETGSDPYWVIVCRQQVQDYCEYKRQSYTDKKSPEIAMDWTKDDSPVAIELFENGLKRADETTRAETNSRKIATLGHLQRPSPISNFPLRDSR